MDGHFQTFLFLKLVVDTFFLSHYFRRTSIIRYLPTFWEIVVYITNVYQVTKGMKYLIFWCNVTVVTSVWKVFDFCTPIYGRNLELVMDYARYRGGDVSDVCAHVTGCVDQSRARMDERQAIRGASSPAGLRCRWSVRHLAAARADNSQALVVFNHPTNRPHDSYYYTLWLYYLLTYSFSMKLK